MTRVRCRNSGSSMTGANPPSRISSTKRLRSSGVISSVTSTSKLRRGAPWRTTACAPKRYHRPQRRRMGASAVNSSMAGDCSGTAEFLGQPLVGGEVFATLGGSGPRRIDPQRLLAQPLGHAECFDGTETGDPLGVVLILPAAHRVPVAGH